MAKLIIEKWKCDRCGVVLDKEPRGYGLEHYSLSAQVDYETAGGNFLTWKEMCQPCNKTVGKELEAMKQSADASRTALAKEPTP